MTGSTRNRIARGLPVRPFTRRAFLRWALAAGTAVPAKAALSTGAGWARGAGRWWSSLVWGVFENHSFDAVSTLPSHRRLAGEGSVLANYFAVAHPSGPNYRAMASGETWGYAEIVNTFHPTVASAAADAEPPIPAYVYHLAGETARRHNPLADLHAPVARTRYGLDALRSDLLGRLADACLVYVGWDDDNDMHNGNVARADRNLATLLDTLAASPWFATPDSAGRYPVLFFTYDEDEDGGANRVFAAWWGRGVRRGFISKRRHSHYSFCRTMTDNWHLPALGRAALETPIDEVWR